MLRKLLILFVIAASIGLAARDVSVDNAWCYPEPAVLNQENSIIASLSNNDHVDHENVPIHGRIAALVGETVLLSEDFEGETFPPADWTQVVSNPDTLEWPCTWSRADVSGEHHNDDWGAYVWPSDTSDMDEWLITPAIDLSDVAEIDVVKLRFSSSFFVFVEKENRHNYVCISTDGGQTWADTLIDLPLDLEDSEPELNNWIYIDDPPNPYEFDLSDYVGDTIVIGFNYYSEPPGLTLLGLQSLDDVTVFVENYEELWSADEVVPVIYYEREGLPPTANSYHFNEPWIPREAGVYRLTVWLRLLDDEWPENDTCITSVRAGETVDLELGMILRPQTKEAPNEFFIPECTVRNKSEDPVVAMAKCTITSEGPISYNDSTIIDIPADTVLPVAFNSFKVGDLGTTYEAYFSVEHPLDSDPTDNFLSKEFEAGYPHYVIPVEAVTPSEGDSLATFNPEAIYKNQGIHTESEWWAIVSIEDLAYHTFWTDTVLVTESLVPSGQTNVVFSEFTASKGVDYICTFSSYMNVEGFEPSDIQVSFSGKSTGATEEGPMPLEYALGVSSNLFSRGLTIKYAIPKSGHVSLKLYDVTGKLLETFKEESVPAGYGSLRWDSKEVPSGLYFLRMEADGFSATRKLVLVR
jgi:hypothetical protein